MVIFVREKEGRSKLNDLQGLNKREYMYEQKVSFKILRIDLYKASRHLYLVITINIYKIDRSK